MASKKQARRRGGHPAKEAQRRERERVKRESSASPLRRTALAMCREGAELDCALDAELWASALLGSWWPPPLDMLTDAVDADLEFCGPLVSEVARIGGPGALATLLALGEVSDGELGTRSLALAEKLLGGGVSAPAWRGSILELRVLKTAVMRDDIFDDGVTIFVEAVHDGEERHAVGVYIDHNLGVMAKDILLADSIDRVEELLREKSDDRLPIRLEAIDPAEAGARIREAMELTDMTFDAPVGEDYAALRALALLRADELPSTTVAIGTPEVHPEEREQLLEDFLAAPEGAAVAAGSDEAYIVSLAIDFCAGYVDERPLRWSPVVVELFMVNWLPHKVIADRETFDVVPAALDAWVRFAGRQRGIPDWAIGRCTEAVKARTAEMFDELDGDHGVSPANELLTAAVAAGVDVTDEQAFATFVSGWNARSDLP